MRAISCDIYQCVIHIWYVIIDAHGFAFDKIKAMTSPRCMSFRFIDLQARAHLTRARLVSAGAQKDNRAVCRQKNFNN